MKKLLLFTIALFVICYTKAQDTTLFNFSFNHIALSVNDVDRSANFYKQV